MLRQSILRASQLTARTSRSFSISARTMAEGDTGGVKSGGAAQGDAFSKREKANEDMYMREQEMAKLRALKQKLAQQKQHIDDLHKDIDSMLGEDDKSKSS